MNKIISTILNIYRTGGSLSLMRKARLFVQATVGCIVYAILLLVMHLIAGGNSFLLAADLSFMSLMAIALYLVYSRKFEAAVVVNIGAFCVAIVVANPVNDYFNKDTVHYLRILETCILFIIGIVIVGVFTRKSILLSWFTVLGILTTVSHYFIIIAKSYAGQHSSASVLALLIYVVFLAFIGFMATFSFSTYNDLIQLVEREADKVKTLNKRLEFKVQERTKQLEIQNKELIKVNNELDHFVYRVSHDLRAPLSSVLGLIAITKLETDSEQIKSYLDLQEKSVTKLDNFIKDIMELSRNARSEVVNEEINFEEVVQDVLDTYAYAENATNIRKMVEVEQGSTFYSDKQRLKIVLGNMISNAIRYHNTYQEQPYLKVHAQIDDHLARIQIEDNGQGIDAEHQAKIFDMFYRASQNKPGTGLGLYIVKETIEKLGGTIRVASEPGVGSCFNIEIPSIQIE